MKSNVLLKLDWKLPPDVPDLKKNPKIKYDTKYIAKNHMTKTILDLLKTVSNIVFISSETLLSVYFIFS
jgi:hypothetical protein